MVACLRQVVKQLCVRMQLAQLEFHLWLWHFSTFPFGFSRDKDPSTVQFVLLSSCHTSRLHRLAQVGCNVSTAAFKWSGNSASPAQTRTVPVEFWRSPSAWPRLISFSSYHWLARPPLTSARSFYFFFWDSLTDLGFGDLKFLILDCSVGHCC